MQATYGSMLLSTFSKKGHTEVYEQWQKSNGEIFCVHKFIGSINYETSMDFCSFGEFTIARD